MRSKRERRGQQYGNKRGKTVQQRKAARQSDHRAMSALEATRAQQAALEARMAAEEAQALEYDRQRLNVREDVPEFVPEAIERAHELGQLRANITKRATWPLADARQLIRVGYSLESTIRRTGWPADMLRDVTPGEW